MPGGYSEAMTYDPWEPREAPAGTLPPAPPEDPPYQSPVQEHRGLLRRAGGGIAAGGLLVLKFLGNLAFVFKFGFLLCEVANFVLQLRQLLGKLPNLLVRGCLLVGKPDNIALQSRVYFTKLLMIIAERLFFICQPIKFALQLRILLFELLILFVGSGLFVCNV